MPTKTANNDTRPARVAAWLYGLGGRRYVMTMGAAIVNTGLFVFKVLSENGYIILYGMTIGAYLGSNTLESIKGDARQPKKGP